MPLVITCGSALALWAIALTSNEAVTTTSVSERRNTICFPGRDLHLPLGFRHEAQVTVLNPTMTQAKNSQ